MLAIALSLLFCGMAQAANGGKRTVIDPEEVAALAEHYTGLARRRQDFDAVIVIDNGSGYIKAGFAGDDTPREMFPDIVGHQKYYTGNNDVYIGDTAIEKADLLDLNRPVIDGFVDHWDDMEKVWHDIYFNKLRKSPDDQPVLMTEHPLNTNDGREKMTMEMFQTFDVPALYIASTAQLALYASGRTTGIVVDSGYDSTTVTPIYEGYAIPEAILRLDVGGESVTNYLSDLLSSEGYSFDDHEIPRDIKETLGYVALNYDSEMRNYYVYHAGVYKDYTMPDYSTINVGPERFKAPEILFQPSLIGVNALGVHELIVSSISKCDSAIQAEMYSNIVLAGGSTMFSGFAERLLEEVSTLATDDVEVKVDAPAERKYAAWIGGSIIADLSSDDDYAMWLKREDFNMQGPTLIHDKAGAIVPGAVATASFMSATAPLGEKTSTVLIVVTSFSVTALLAACVALQYTVWSGKRKAALESEMSLQQAHQNYVMEQ